MLKAMSKTMHPQHVMLLTEQQSGMRFCKACNKLLPLDKFKPEKRKYTCIEHLKAQKREMNLGTQEKRAFNSIRCRARVDMLTLGHTKMVLSRPQVVSMLTEHQLQNFAEFAIVPKKPDQMLTIDNAVLVLSYQRNYVMTKYKESKDPAKYEQDLAFIQKE